MQVHQHIKSPGVHQQLLAQSGGAVVQCYRESGLRLPVAGDAVPLPMVLLHGIGSGAASWVYQLSAADKTAGSAHGPHMLAWDAPGYGDSTAVLAAVPTAQDYAQRLWQWLDAMDLARVHLVGHSLGCIMAASAARLQPQRVASLTLLAPAQGYARAPQELRNKKRDDRLQMLATLGAVKMAQARGPALLAPGADKEHIALAVNMMGQVSPAGYTQATHMLANADILTDLHAFQAHSTAPMTVACGDLDSITPPKACSALADAVHAPYMSLGAVGHLCAVEASNAVNQLLMHSQKEAAP